MAVGMLILLDATTAKRLYFYAIIFGFGYGSLAPMMPILTADRFGRHIMGSVYGLLTFLIGMGGAVGPILGGVIFDALGSYARVWQLNMIMLAVAAIVILTLKKDPPAS
jgi:MFS family permease